MTTDQRLTRAGGASGRSSGSPDIGRAGLRLPAVLCLAGQVLFILITQFHAGGDANDHESIFTTYAGSWDWKGVHALQFGAVALVVAGLIALFVAVRAQVDQPAWAARIGAVFAAVSLALYGALQAVDGVGNKQVDAAWERASAADKSARFASAESMRWLEWGFSSYHAYVLGLALLMFAAAAARAAAIPRAVPCLMGLAGLADLAQGWVAGTDGFTATHSTLIVASWVFSLAWMVWLAAVAWRAPGRRSPVGVAPAH
jgi:hypothetical protein